MCVRARVLSCREDEFARLYVDGVLVWNEKLSGTAGTARCGNTATGNLEQRLTRTVDLGWVNADQINLKFTTTLGSAATDEVGCICICARASCGVGRGGASELVSCLLLCSASVACLVFLGVFAFWCSTSTCFLLLREGHPHTHPYTHPPMAEELNGSAAVDHRFFSGSPRAL
jgi:hypothetical protein